MDLEQSFFCTLGKKKKILTNYLQNKFWNLNEWIMPEVHWRLSFLISVIINTFLSNGTHNNGSVQLFF